MGKGIMIHTLPHLLQATGWSWWRASLKVLARTDRYTERLYVMRD